ncbi:hypothetical protein BLNAU_14206 [Blattamonas nauphoetae]|uniref:Uncharacterized protein n=1 Tax=Blattamonas nauphoetae TaxID=2049346 RepID=A0ABQ9XJB2_9EUKA|nr:hypothetical protein BLNAU_14206 [Blattamonas nauphoetae]
MCVDDAKARKSDLRLYLTDALNLVVERDPAAFTLLPSPIFPSSSPYQQCSGLSFLSAMTRKLRIGFSEFQQNLPTDPSHLQKYVQLTKDDPYKITRSICFCSSSFVVPNILLRAPPPIEIDSEIIRDFILFVKDALPTILTLISTFDDLIASLPSDSSPTTPLASGVDTQMADSLKALREDSKVFVSNGWNFLINLTHHIQDPHKSSFQTILLDDPSFTDLILNSLKLNYQPLRRNTTMTLTNIVVGFPSMKEKFMTANLVGRMFETVDFVSLPLSESQTLFALVKIITTMFNPIGDNDEERLEQFHRIRVSVLEPAKPFVIFIFHNSNKLILDEADKTKLENHLCWIHHRIKNMELRSDEHDADIVSELMKWEMRAMIEMENEDNFQIVFQSMVNRTWYWNQNKRERQKRREVVWREEGWDDAFELRVVGIEVEAPLQITDSSAGFRNCSSFNTDEL